MPSRGVRRLLSLPFRLPHAATAAKLIAVLAAIGVGVGVFLQMRPEPRPASERLQEALTLLDAHPPPLDDRVGDPAEHAAARAKAARMALSLLGNEARGVQARPVSVLPHFPGAAAYVVGMEALGRAHVAQADHGTAAAYLLRAEREGVPVARRPALLTAAGLSLLRAGRPAMGFTRLRDALGKDDPTGLVSQARLFRAFAEAAVADGREASLREAAERLTAMPVASLARDDAAALLRARGQIALARHDRDAAAAALESLHRNGRGGGDLAVRLALLTDDVAAARAALPPVPRFPFRSDAVALFLHGRVEEASGDPTTALLRYQVASQLAPDSVVGLSARLAEARLLTDAGRFEEAAEALASAVRGAADAPGRLGNDLRDELTKACDVAIQTAATAPNAARHCVALCDVAEPALGAPRARRLKADVLAAAAKVDADRALEAGRAFAAWAKVEPDQAGRRAALLAAADYLRLAGRPGAALTELDQVPIEGDVDPGGLVMQRARLLLDLGRADEARETAEDLVRDRPADPAAPAARTLIGRAALEAGDADTAIDAWTAVLTDSELTPAAAEWRECLFARATLAAEQALAKVPIVAAPDAVEGDTADAALADAVNLLSECLVRYPADAGAAAVRLARARCRLARCQRLDSNPAAGPLNRRRRAERTTEDLSAALADFRLAETAIYSGTADAALTDAQAVRLWLTRLGAAECLTRLGRLEAGGVAVAAAVDRDPLSVRSAAALLDLAAVRRAAGDEAGGRLAAEQARLTVARLPDKATRSSPLSRGEWDRLFLLARRSPEADAPEPAPVPARNAAP